MRLRHVSFKSYYWSLFRGLPISLLTLCLTYCGESHDSVGFFTIIMLGQYESIPSHLSVSSPSQFCSDRDIVNISDIANIAFLFLGIKGKSRIFFNFGFITLVKRHGSLVEV